MMGTPRSLASHSLLDTSRMAFVLRTSPRTTNVVDSVGAYDTVAPALRSAVSMRGAVSAAAPLVDALRARSSLR